MIKLTVPSDFQIKTIDEYLDMEKPHAKVDETYGELTSQFGSGRASHLLPPIDKVSFEKYLNYSQKRGITFNYTFNSTCIGNAEMTKIGLKKLIEFIHSLLNLGVRKFTVTLPSLIEIIKNIDSNVQIKASTMCGINTVNKLQQFIDKGISHIVVDEGINRDFQLLTKMAQYTKNLEVIINSICDKNCIYRYFHQNQAAHYQEGQHYEYYLSRCSMQRFEKPENFFHLCWIRPEDIFYYENIGIEKFKIQGRQAVGTGNIQRCVKAYRDGSFEGNLYELLNCFQPLNSFKYNIDNKKISDFIIPFVSGKLQCKSDCKNCGYCRTYSHNHINESEIAEMNRMEKKFINETEDFLYLN